MPAATCTHRDNQLSFAGQTGPLPAVTRTLSHCRSVSCRQELSSLARSLRGPRREQVFSQPVSLAQRSHPQKGTGLAVQGGAFFIISVRLQKAELPAPVEGAVDLPIRSPTMLTLPLLPAREGTWGQAPQQEYSEQGATCAWESLTKCSSRGAL